MNILVDMGVSKLLGIFYSGSELIHMYIYIYITYKGEFTQIDFVQKGMPLIVNIVPQCR